MDTKTSQRNIDNTHQGDVKPEKQALLASEVKNMSRQHKTNEYAALADLRAKYNDDQFIYAVTDKLREKNDFLKRKAKKFQTLLKSKYVNRDLTHSDIIRKAKKYQKKYDLTNDDFNMFLTLIFQDHSYGSQNLYNIPNNEMSKALGYSSVISVGDKLRINDSQLTILQEILKICGDPHIKNLYANILLQTLSYRDCAPESINGEYIAGRNDPFDFVPAILAALFLPKVRYLEEHMLIANIANIVKTKYEGNPIMTSPEFELFWDLITDPNETVYDSGMSAIGNLFNRTNLQLELWRLVMLLRQGRYYDTKSTLFNECINKLPDFTFDTPDMTYVNDEGTLLRKLLGAFSLRPTVVTTTPLYGVGFSILPMPTTNATSLSKVTTVPMITFRIPFKLTAKNAYAGKLLDALEQPQWYFENKMIIPKNQQILHSRDVIFFYVPRRYQNIGFTRLTAPFAFNRLPMTLSGFERINDLAVDYDDTITIMNDVFHLRSVVVVEASRFVDGLIIGNTALIRAEKNGNMNGFVDGFLVYDPRGSGEYFMNQTGEYSKCKPVTYIYNSDNLTVNGYVESFRTRVMTRGTIFMYVKDGASNLHTLVNV